MIASASSCSSRSRPALIASARAILIALAFACMGGVAGAGPARAGGLSDAGGPDSTGPGVMPYGLASDSVVRARCEGATIRQVEIRCLDIFDPVPKSDAAFLYRGVNRLHVRTRQATVRSQILISPGQLWTADHIIESQRLLRSLEYIEPEPIRSRLAGDSVDVLVITHDQWTTQPELNLERGGGFTYGAIGLTERNFIGLGMALSLQFRTDPTGRTRSFAATQRRLFGSQLEAQYKAGTGTAGVSNSFYLFDPFRSLDDTRSWTVSSSRSITDYFLYEDGLTAATFPFRVEIAQAEYAFGRRTTDGVVRRFAMGVAQHDRKYGVTEFQPFSTLNVASGEEELKLRWVSARFTLWRPDFIERRSIELFDPIEDFDVGPRLGLEGGLAMTALGSTANEGIVKVQLDAGKVTRTFGFGFARTRFSTRLRREPIETLSSVDVRWIQQPRRDVAVVLAAFGEASGKAPREVQGVIGGLNGLRAYSVQELAGTQLWRFNGETRWVAARNVLDLASLGGAAFVDAAHVWGTGAGAAPWHSDAGFGLRLSFPHASLHQVARFDLAFPLSPTRDGRRDPVFSFGSSQAF